MDKQRSEHIENRFRQAAENFLPPPPTNEAWRKMEALLDEKPKKRRFLIWWWPVGLLLLSIAIGGYFYHTYRSSVPTLSNHVSEKAITSQESRKEARNRTEMTPATAAENDPHPEAGSAQDAGKTTGSLATPHSGRLYPAPDRRPDNQGGGRPVAENSSRSVSTIPSSAFGNARSGDGYRKRAAASQGIKKGARTAGLNTGAYLQAAPVATEAGEDLHAFAGLPPLETRTVNFSITVPDSMLNRLSQHAAIKDSLQTSIERIAKKQTDNSLKNARFYFVVSGSSNATSLRRFDIQNEGNVYGAEIGYHVNNWLAVQAGFHAGRKIYFAGKGDYKWGSSYPLDSIKSLKIDADCLIFDLPLSLRFDLLHHQSNALYAIAGISSFLMNSEVYNYHITTQSNWYYKSLMKYRGNFDWFSSINLSVGFEQRLFRYFYLQAEPYAKLPIAGVGAGSVKLYSLGLQVGLKYQPLKRK